MSEQNDNGNQVATAPESAPVQSEADKKFYEMNPHLGKSESDQKAEEKPSEGVKEDKPKQENANPENGQSESRKRSGWERRVSTLTRHNKELATKLEELEKKLGSRTDSQEPKKFSRDAFKSDEEYWNHIAEEKAKEIVNRTLAEREKQNDESLEEIQARSRFEKEWHNRAKEALGSDAATSQYMSLVKESHENGVAEEIPQDVYAFLENSEIGALMHSILLTRDDIRTKIANTPEQLRLFKLYDLQRNIMSNRYKEQETQKKHVQAPDPVGIPNVGGSAKDEKNLPWSEQLAIYAKKNQKF